MVLILLLLAASGILLGVCISRFEFLWLLVRNEKKSALAMGTMEDIVVDSSEKESIQKSKAVWSVGRTVVVSLVLALVIPHIFFYNGFSVSSYAYGFLACLLCAVTLTDLDTETIPNSLIAAGVCGWLVSIWFAEVPAGAFGLGSYFVPYFGVGFVAPLLDGLLAGFLIGGGMLLFSSVYEQVSGKHSMGGGDIKLLFMVSLFLGVGLGFLNLILSCVVGLVFAGFWRMRQRRHGVEADENITMKKDVVKTFPFGPAISISTLMCVAGMLMFAA